MNCDGRLLKTTNAFEISFSETTPSGAPFKQRIPRPQHFAFHTREVLTPLERYGLTAPAGSVGAQFIGRYVR